MLIDGRSVETGTTLDADLCIVGAGAAGLATALDFLGTPFSVIVLESGDAAAPGAEPEGASGRAVERLFEGRARSPLLSQRNRYLEATRARGFGGLGDRWRGSCRPLDAADFAARDWVSDSGWPLAATELEPWLGRAAELLGVGPGAANEPPPAIGRGFEASWLAYAPRPSIAELFRPAFQSATQVRVLTHAHATQLLLDDASRRVDSATVRCLDGPRLTVRARAFVLAAGVFENPRLLLASNRQRARGLGNELDLVGRFFMEQVVLRAGHAVLTGLPGVFRPYGSAALHDPSRHPRRAVLRLPEKDQESHELLNALVFLEPASMAASDPLTPDLARLSVDARDLGATSGPSTTVELATVIVRGEQTPRPGSRVRLGGKRDPFDMPTANLNWNISWHDAWSLRSTARLLGESLGRAGDGRLRLETDSRVTRPRYTWSGHQSGTTRMSRRAEQGVVDPDCRVHDLENLYVAGSSVFPTGGCSGPMLTTLALALRLSDHLRGVLSRSGSD